MEVSNNNSIKSYTKKPFIFIIIVLILIAGTRVAQGADYWPYLKLYIGSNQFVRWENVFKTDIEPTYVILSKILGKLHLPFFVLLTTFATISLTLKSYTFFKFSPYPFFSLLFFYMPFFFFQDMGHIRQGVAIACCLFSYNFIIQKKLLKFLLCVLIGYYFHKTAIVFLPAYWIANRHVSTIQAFFILLTSIILSPFRPYTWFGNLFQSISADTLADAYISYQSMGDLSFSIGDSIKLIFIFIIFFFDKENIKTNPNPNYMKIRNLAITYFCFYYAFRENIIFSTRLPSVYEASLCILFAIIIKNNKTSFSKFGLYFFITIYIYMMSVRFWENSRKIGFDKFNNIFSYPYYNNAYFTPNEFID